MTNEVSKQILKAGDIIAAKSTYSWEFLSYTFYKVLKVTPTMAYIQELEREYIYEDGKTGPHCYDAPYKLAPKKVEGHYVVNPEILRRKIYYTKSGLPKIKVDFDKISVGVWDGEPLSAHNYH